MWLATCKKISKNIGKEVGQQTRKRSDEATVNCADRGVQ